MPDTHYLAPLLKPASVAVIGATERPGSIGAVLIENMLDARFSGPLYAVNPKHRQVRGVPCFPSISDVPVPVDLAVVATPPRTVPQVVEQCGIAGVRSAVVITAGFAEVGAEGVALERAMLENARRYGLRFLGPNCLGLIRTEIGLNATFGRGNAIKGRMALVSQSGAICTALLDWARSSGVGFSSVVSLGGSADVDFGDIVDFLTFDPATEQILLYIEGIRSARRFLSAVRAAARAKPVIIMKSGRHPSGARAAVSHTGALVGVDDVFDAAVRRTGAVRLKTVGQLVAAAQALSSQVRPRGDRVAIVTNGGGPGVLAADWAADIGVPLAELAPQTVDALTAALPPNWSHANPIDLIGDADAARYRAAVTACLADPGVDGVLAILTPQAMTSPTDAAKAVVEAAKPSDKPLLAVWMGEAQVIEGRAVFQAAGIPVFRTPEPAVEMFGHVAAFYSNQRQLMQTPGPLTEQEAPDVESARRVIQAALDAGEPVLSGAASKAVLAAFHIPVARSLSARSADDAVSAARELGFPVVLKIESPDITHKTDVGGVRLNLRDAEAVRAAYDSVLAAARRMRPDARVEGATVERMVSRANARELLLGVITDRVFGPVVTFGAGGTAVEVLRDRAIGLPPLNAFLAREMIRSTRVSRMLGAFRDMAPANAEAIENALLRVSEMVCELPEIEELDVNPLIASESGVIAADARIVVARRPPAARLYGHVAIHPYPTHLVAGWTARDGTPVTIRPIRPEDAQIESEFVSGLSPQAKYMRFMGSIRDLTPSMLARFTQVDYDREMALIAVVRGPDGAERQIAVARYVTNPDGKSCDFAIVVGEDWQGKGLGRHLMLELIGLAKARGLETMSGQVLSVNTQMLQLVAALGFVIGESPDDYSVKEVVLELG